MKSLLMAGAAVFAFATGASATTYVGSESLPGASVAFSLTTDGATGVLSQADITGWDIAITDAANTVDINTGNSGLLLEGSSLSATASAVTFDFSGDGLLLFEISSVGDSGPFWCGTAVSGCYPGQAGPSIGVATEFGESPIEQIAESGPVVLGTAGVPEPAAWSLMILGLGAVGGALRSGRRRLAAA